MYDRFRLIGRLIGQKRPIIIGRLYRQPTDLIGHQYLAKIDQKYPIFNVFQALLQIFPHIIENDFFFLTQEIKYLTHFLVSKEV